MRAILETGPPPIPPLRKSGGRTLVPTLIRVDPLGLRSSHREIVVGLVLSLKRELKDSTITLLGLIELSSSPCIWHSVNYYVVKKLAHKIFHFHQHNNSLFLQHALHQTEHHPFKGLFFSLLALFVSRESAKFKKFLRWGRDSRISTRRDATKLRLRLNRRIWIRLPKMPLD